ncbi:hypothetical protein DL93DRAFT_1840678 [Clavulina sp. PMI_390]|nr:hypothetical protein DL93DRAFT_1840678 [Clavulina sp. PMI_390]
MKPVLDSAFSLLQDALSTLAAIKSHEDISHHVLRASPADRPSRRCGLQAALVNLDEVIDSAQAVHDTVTTILASLRRKKATFHHALYSPVHSLPVELLQHIFRMLAREAGRSGVVVTLTHVCSLWRAASLGSGRLWEHVNVRSTKFLSQLVARSQPHLFALELGLPLGIPSHSTRSSMIQFDPQDVRRLSSLSISDPSILKLIDFPNDSLLPNLISLHINATLIREAHLPSIPHPLKSTLTMQIENWERPRCVMNDGPWPRLTRIFFQHTSPMSAVRVLDKMVAPSLETLIFANMTNELWSRTSPRMTLPLPAVQTIIMIDSSRFIDSFRRNFHLFPNLTSITLSYLDDERDYNWARILESLPSVTILTVLHAPSNLDTLVTLASSLVGAQQVPKLEALKINLFHDFPALMEALPAPQETVASARSVGNDASDGNLPDPYDVLPFANDPSPSTSPVATALADALRQRTQIYGLPRLRLLVLSRALGGDDNYFFWGLSDVVTVLERGESW